MGLPTWLEKGKLPKTFLAFEVLNQISIAQEKKFSRDEYLGVVPDCFASKTVEVPVHVLNTLLDCYDHFIHSDPTKASLEQSFGFAAPKPKSRPIQHVIEKLDKKRNYDVLEKYSDPSKINKKLSWKANYDGKKVVELIINEKIKKKK